MFFHLISYWSIIVSYNHPIKFTITDLAQVINAFAKLFRPSCSPGVRSLSLTPMAPDSKSVKQWDRCLIWAEGFKNTLIHLSLAAASQAACSLTARPILFRGIYLFKAPRLNPVKLHGSALCRSRNRSSDEKLACFGISENKFECSKRTSFLSGTNTVT